MVTMTELEAQLAKVKSLSERADSALDKKKKEESDLAKKIQGGVTKPSLPIIGGDSDEKRAMKFFRCSSIKELISINVCDPRFRLVPAELKYIVLQLKETVDVARHIAQLFHGAPRDIIGKTEKEDRIAHVKNLLDTYYGRHELAARIKSFGSTVSGGGDEWVPTLMSNNYIEEFQLVHVVENQFEQVNMQSNPYDLPVQSGLKKARIIAENTAITDTNFTTGKITFSAIKLGEFHVLPEELNEDSAPNVLAAARQSVLYSQIRAVESAIINGDNDGTHIDSDTQAGAADLAEKAFKGLRRQAIANSANGGTTNFAGAAATEANCRLMRSKMKKFGSLPSDLVWIAGPVVYQQMQAFPTVTTIDKAGPNATIQKGELSYYQGIPIVNSEHMREDLNASGVYDGTTTTFAGLLLVNKKRWYVGQRRPIRVKVENDLAYHDRMLLASYQRKDFQGHTQGASEVSVSYGINIAV